VNLTEYLAEHIATDRGAMRQVLSLINERGYEEQAAERLHEWVRDHMHVILSYPVVSNPYPVPWHVWMKDILKDDLQRVEWKELVDTLRSAAPLKNIGQ